jgi:subtilisin-like proprotein convertase family protein
VTRFAAFVLFGSVALASGAAQADVLQSARGQPLVEVSHSVTLSVNDGVAVYRVRRTFANNGKTTDEARVRIDLPPGAAVTGLRIRARDRWYTGELLEREEAAERYQHLTSMGAWEPMDPALLQWVWADRVRLQVFPVSSGAASTVEYTLTAPLHYSRGKHRVAYPRLGRDGDSSMPLAAPVLRFEPGYGDATTEVHVDGQRVTPGMPVVLDALAPLPWIGEGEPDPSASQVWSKVSVGRVGSVSHAAVDVEIDHTYRGDLALHLVTPSGGYLALDEISGDGNDVRETFLVELPAGTKSEGDWHLAVADEAGLDVGTLERWRLRLSNGEVSGDALDALPTDEATDTPVFIPDAPEGEGDAGLALIEFEPEKFDRLRARLGTVRASAESGFTRLEVEAAPELSRLPRKPSVVFVVDASKSVGDVSWQLAVAEAYLSHVPDATVEVVVFRRRGERVLNEFIPAKAFAERMTRVVEAGGFEVGNGSALDHGIREAARALANRRGSRRMVVLSDGLVRTRFENEDAIKALGRTPRNIVTHVVLPSSAGGWEPGFRRDDAHPLAPIPASTGGVLYGLAGHEDTVSKALTREALALVRPVAIDDFRVRGMDLADAPEAPEVLREGEGYQFMLATPEPLDELIIDGRIWGRKYRKRVRVDRAFSRATAAFVFSEDEFDHLDEQEMLTVAMKGRAVSPVTSYLAIEPGVRPSTDGFVDELIGTGSGAAYGVGGLGLVGTGSGGGGGTPVTLRELVEEGMNTCVDRLTPKAGWEVEFEVESTYDEVVDVKVRAMAPGTSAKMRACLVEAVWAVDLSWNFAAQRELHKLVLPGS